MRACTFYDIYACLYATLGITRAPRGMRTIEIENFSYTLPPYVKFANFPSRKLNIDYIKAEFRWYLKGDPTDLSIADKASIWKDSITDGRLNSNYGFYLFKQGQLDYVVNTLTRDPESRRAMAIILGAHHLYPENRDVPCTSTLGFRIRDGALNLTVHMRSQDAIFGLGNDVPFFSLVQELTLNLLPKKYSMGNLTVFVDSLHVYERHFDMLKTIVLNKESTTPLDWPRIKRKEAKELLSGICPAFSETFSQWLWI